jgi:hypothetical protein
MPIFHTLKKYVSVETNSMKDNKIKLLQQEREEAKAQFEATVRHHEAKHSEPIAELHLTQVKICILVFFCTRRGRKSAKN